MYWSQTESSKWSLESLFNHLRRPRMRRGVNRDISRKAIAVRIELRTAHHTLQTVFNTFQTNDEEATKTSIYH